LRFCIRPVDGAFGSWPSWISARARSHSRLGPEGHTGHLITNALARPFLHLLFPTRRPRRESGQPLARDDGRFANSPLKPWFDRLASGKGLCCSFADGVSVEDVDWDTQDGQYRVRIDGQWVIIPDVAVVTEPNRFGPAVVWPYKGNDGTTQIRCFMPGAGT